jgi:hypothetical protein
MMAIRKASQDMLIAQALAQTPVEIAEYQQPRPCFRSTPPFAESPLNKAAPEKLFQQARELTVQHQTQHAAQSSLPPEVRTAQDQPKLLGEQRSPTAAPMSEDEMLARSRRNLAAPPYADSAQAAA